MNRWLNLAGVDRNGRAFCEERGVRRGLQACGKIGTVERVTVAVEACLGGAPHAPGFVLDAVFESRAVGLRRVAPVVVRDELFERAFRGARGFAFALEVEIRPAAVQAETVPHLTAAAFADRTGDLVPHGERDVALVVD